MYPVQYEMIFTKTNHTILRHKRKEDLSLEPLIKIRFVARGKRVLLAFGAGVTIFMINSHNDDDTFKQGDSKVHCTRKSEFFIRNPITKNVSRGTNKPYQEVAQNMIAPEI